MIFSTQIIAAQETEADTLAIKSKKSKRFYVETGIHIPIDDLAEVIKPSPQIGVWYRSEFQKNNFVEFGFNVFIPLKNESFVFKVPDTLIKTNAEGISGMVGFRFNKIYHPFHKKDVSIELNTSLGYAFFMYDANYHRYLNELENESKTDKPYSRAFSTFHIGTGVKFNYKNIGCQVHYQWTPYALFSDYIDKNLGAQAIQIGIFYRQ